MAQSSNGDGAAAGRPTAAQAPAQPDQTRPEWVARAEGSERGTGLYAVGNPEAFSARSIADVSYSQFSAMMTEGKTPFVYQWVPHSIASEEDLLKVECVPAPCTPIGSLCAQPGCFCVGGTCRNRS